MPDWLTVLNREVIACTRCPRLVAYREQIAREKRRAYRDWDYWGKPVPSFGDPRASVIILGLAIYLVRSKVRREWPFLPANAQAAR